MDIRIRPCRVEDIDRIAAMEAAIFSEPWTKTGFLETLSETEHVFLVAEDQENLCAYGILYCNSDEGEIPTIAVSEEARGRGLGKRLLSRMMEEAEKRGVAHVYLEVRKSNLLAQRLYQACGFSLVGQRKGFYHKPDEDAFVMAFHKEDIC